MWANPRNVTPLHVKEVRHAGSHDMTPCTWNVGTSECMETSGVLAARGSGWGAEGMGVTAWWVYLVISG